ncbi:tubulin--tyrosine ligase-like protein 12-like, partial [Trifolium medium]|nr:tubulin--tyrosine ligase-like protein 12-like [Trifolium medium]
MVAMATVKRIETFEDFAKVHGILLAASGLPESLHRRLFQKLSTETFDGGEHFQIEPCEDNRMRRLVLTSDSMAKDSNLREVPGLAERMSSLMCVDIDTNLDGENE